MVNIRIARMSLINNFLLAFITSHHSITFNCRLIINSISCASAIQKKVFLVIQEFSKNEEKSLLTPDSPLKCRHAMTTRLTQFWRVWGRVACDRTPLTTRPESILNNSLYSDRISLGIKKLQIKET